MSEEYSSEQWLEMPITEKRKACCAGLCSFLLSAESNHCPICSFQPTNSKYASSFVTQLSKPFPSLVT